MYSNFYVYQYILFQNFYKEFDIIRRWLCYKYCIIPATKPKYELGIATSLFTMSLGLFPIRNCRFWDASMGFCNAYAWCWKEKLLWKRLKSVVIQQKNNCRRLRMQKSVQSLMIRTVKNYPPDMLKSHRCAVIQRNRRNVWLSKD